MATIKNIKLIENEPLDIYLDTGVIAAGIVPGDRLLVQNVGSTNLYFSSNVLKPTPADGFVRVPPSVEAANETGDLNAWVLSAPVNGAINVKLAP